METGFLNFHDEEHFSSLPSTSIYHQTAMLDDDSSLLDMIPDQLEINPWADLDQDLDRHDKSDDFHKMLNDWQDQLSSLQTSDSEEIYDAVDDLDLDTDELLTASRKPPLVGKDLSLARLACEDDEETRGLLEVGGGTEIDDDDYRIDMDDECIDVESVSNNEQIPVLVAGDVTTLLEQFEASESMKPKQECKRSTYLDTCLFAMSTQPVGSAMSHQNIIDALPREVIERIKASGRKKAIPVIPAMPSRKPGRAGTRMQDAGAALTRNKLLKIVSSAPSTGESIQLDHDYCSAANSSLPSPEVLPPRSFYHSDASDYSRSEERVKQAPTYSRLPDYYLVLGDSCTKRDKDSGLESGELSDVSEEDKTVNVESANCDKVDGPRDKIVTINGKTINLGSIMHNVNKALTSKDTPMVSVLKRNASPEKIAKKVDVKIEKEEPKKRKLNLSEYRTRFREFDRHRSSGESSRATSPLPSPQTFEEAKQIFEQATQMLINAEGKIDKESFAEMKKTLEKQSLLQIPCHKEYRPKEAKPEKVFQLHQIDIPPKKETSHSVDKYKSLVQEVKDIVADVTPVLPTEEEPAAAQVEMIEDVLELSTNDQVDMDITDDPGAPEEYSYGDEETVVTGDPVIEKQEEIVTADDNSEKEKSLFDDRVKLCDRSRRQFRSRRCDSSSSSSSNTSHVKPSAVCSRSHSRSSSSSYSSRSRSSSSKSRRWRGTSRDRYSRERSPIQRGYSRAPTQKGYQRSWNRSRSPVARQPDYQLSEREKERQVEERRVIYVGRIGESMTKAELRTRFESFGPIIDISLHFREHADNYGFVTFAYKVDAYAAVEQGKKDPALNKFDLSFGGRRAFCKSRYADLDVGRPDDVYGYTPTLPNRPRPATNSTNFDDLLREAMKKKKPPANK